MKKAIGILAALLLALLPAAGVLAEETEMMDETGPEETNPAETVPGSWYADTDGIVFCLTLNADGTYTAAAAPSGEDAYRGTWQAEGDLIRLDGQETPAFVILEDALYWKEMQILLRREEPETYIPAETVAEAAQESFAGYWKSVFTQAGGVILYTADLGDRTDLYLEGTHAVLGGDFFGDTPAAFTYADGAMTLKDEETGIAILLQMQKDDMMRMTLDTGEEQVIWYLTPIDNIR